MKDKDFYGSGSHPEAGEQLVKIDGQWFSKVDIDYLKSQSPKSLNKINSSSLKIGDLKSDTVNHTGFSKSRIINEDGKSKREQQLDRLVILQNTEARLVKDLERTRSVIKSIKSDLSI